MKLFLLWLGMIGLCLISWFIPTKVLATNYVKVIWVADGDTIQVEGGQLVRYLGINAPELHHPNKPIGCFGKEAFEKNRELVLGKFVRLEKDKTDKDKYGRLLRFVYLKDSPIGNMSVGEYLLSEGYAKTLMIKPDVKYSKEFKTDQKLAKKLKKGLWKTCK